MLAWTSAPAASRATTRPRARPNSSAAAHPTGYVPRRTRTLLGRHALVVAPWPTRSARPRASEGMPCCRCYQARRRPCLCRFRPLRRSPPRTSPCGSDLIIVLLSHLAVASVARARTWLLHRLQPRRPQCLPRSHSIKCPSSMWLSYTQAVPIRQDCSSVASTGGAKVLGGGATQNEVDREGMPCAACYRICSLFYIVSRLARIGARATCGVASVITRGTTCYSNSYSEFRVKNLNDVVSLFYSVINSIRSRHPPRQ